MKLNLEDLVPGSQWIQSGSGLIFEIVIGPYCSIEYDYNEPKQRYARTFPIFKDDNPRRTISYNPAPQIVKKYLSGSDKYIGKCTSANAYNFLHHASPYTQTSFTTMTRSQITQKLMDKTVKLLKQRDENYKSITFVQLANRKIVEEVYSLLHLWEDSDPIAVRSSSNEVYIVEPTVNGCCKDLRVTNVESMMFNPSEEEDEDYN
jgi:hypothetical protein